VAISRNIFHAWYLKMNEMEIQIVEEYVLNIATRRFRKVFGKSPTRIKTRRNEPEYSWWKTGFHINESDDIAIVVDITFCDLNVGVDAHVVFNRKRTPGHSFVTNIADPVSKRDLDKFFSETAKSIKKEIGPIRLHVLREKRKIERERERS